MNKHHVFAGLAAGLVTVGHQVPGAVGWILSGLGWLIATAVDPTAIVAPPSKGNSP